jgi:hypothetical protein
MFEFIELKKFKYEPIELAEGTRIKILSFSGGKYCDYETNYYYQFIGVIKGTSDTVRILSQCQQYDFDKGPREAGFSTHDDYENLIKSAGPDNIPEEIREKLNFDESGKKSYIVFNKKQSFLEKRNFKTARGTLGFDIR